MARKTLGTRQKLVFRLPSSRPGNPPDIPTDKRRKAGPPCKDTDADRRAAKVQLPNQPGEEDGQDTDS